MFLTVVLAILFVLYGIPLILGMLGGIVEMIDGEEHSTGCLRFIIIAIIICALMF